VCGAVDEMDLDKRSFTQSIETQLDTRMARSFQGTRYERSGMVRRNGVTYCIYERIDAEFEIACYINDSHATQ
jgi:hypothetical protein